MNRYDRNTLHCRFCGSSAVLSHKHAHIQYIEETTTYTQTKHNLVPKEQPKFRFKKGSPYDEENMHEISQKIFF